MNKTIRILHVEDSDRDAQLLAHHISEAGYDVVAARVDNAVDLRKILTEVWDVVLCDYTMPNFDARGALALVRELAVDVPMIVISGTVGEAVAVEVMRAGAQDYLMKDNLVRLVPVIERELKDAEDRRAQQAAENALIRSEEHLSALMDSVNGILWEADAQTFQFTYVSPRAERLLHYPLKRWTEEPTFWADHIHPDDREEAVRYCAECTRDNRNHEFEYRMLAADGSIVWVCDIVTVIMEDGRAKTLSGIMVDITERKRVEGELASSEARFRAIYEAEPACVKLVGKECELLDMNPAGLSMIGAKSLDQVRGESILDLIVPEYRDAFAELNTKVYSGESGTLEFEIICLKGDRKWVDTHATPLLNDQGEVEAHLGLTRNITEKKAAEQKLRESESLLSSTQRIAHIGSWVIDLSDSGTGEKTNESWSDEHYRIYGFEPGEVEITDEVFYNSVHPDDRERLANTIRESIEHKTPFDIEHGIILPDGRERIVHAMAEVVIDHKTGKPLKLLGSVQDITERKQAERELAFSEARLRLALQAARLGTYDWDVPNDHIVWSRWHEELWGYAPGEFDGTYKAFSDRIHPDDLAEINAKVAKCVATGERFNHECRVLWPDDSVHWVAGIGEVEFDGDGKPVRMLGAVQDITARKRAEEALRESERAELAAAALQASILNALPAHIALLDPQGLILFVNEAWRRFATANVLQGSDFGVDQNYLEVCITAQGDCAEEADDAARGIRSVLSGEIQEFTLEYPCHSPTEKRWFRLMATPLQEGRLSGAVVMHVNITERKLAEEAQRKSEERLRLLFDQMKDGFYYSTAAGQLLNVNPAMVEMFGYSSREEMLEVDVTRDLYFSPEERKSQTLDDHKDESEVYRMRRKDGSEIWVEDRGEYKYDEEGIVAFHQGLLRDVTERKQAEDRERSRIHILDLLTSDADLATILDFIASSMDVEDPSALCSILLLDEEGKHLRHGAAPKLPDFYNQAIDGVEIGEGVGSCGTAAFTKQRVVVEDILTHPYWVNYRELAEKADLRACCSEPIISNDGRVLGCFAIYHREPRAFANEDIRRIERATGFAKLAIERKGAEAAMRDSEQRYRDLVENAYDMIYTRDMDGNCTSINFAGEKLTGYSREEFLQMNMREIVVPEDRDRANEIIAHKLDGNEETSYVMDILGKDGRRITLEVNTTLIYRAGVAVGMQGIARDITERKRADAALSELRRELELMMDTMEEGVHRIDLEGNIIFENPAAARMLGWEASELLGRPSHLTIHHTKPDGTPYPKEQCPIYASSHGGTSRQVVVDEVFWRQDGSSFPVEYSTTPMRNDQNEIVGSLVTFRDIAERKRVENQLIESESYKGAIIESSLDCIIAIDSQGLVTEFNPAAERVFGCQRADAIGKELAELIVPPALRDQHRRGMQHYLATGEGGMIGKRTEISAMRCDGSEFPVELAINAIESNGSTVFTAFLRDISERKLAEENLKNSEERYRDLVENAYDIIYTRDMDGNITSMNAAGEKLFGYSQEEFRQLNMSQIVAPEDLGRAKELTALKLDGIAGTSYEMDNLTKDGRRITLEVNTTLIYRDGAAVGVQGIARDITERKRSEEEKARLNAILHTTTDMVGTADLKGLVQYINRAGRKMIGLGEEEDVSKMRIADYHPEWAASVITNEGIPAAIETGSWSGETAILSRDGREIPVSQVIIAHKGHDGTLAYLSTIARDVSESKRIEKQLIASEAHKRVILESALDCIIAMNSEGLVTEFNPAAEKLFGYSRANVIGKQLAELIIPPDMRDQHQRGMEHYLATGEGPVIGKRFEILAMRSDGSEFPVELAINAVEVSGSPVFTAYLRDISERRLAEESLIFSEQRYRDLVENAHDIIYTLDLKGNFTSLNEAGERITGYTPEEVMKMNFSKVVAPEHRDHGKMMMEDKLSGVDRTSYEIDIVAKDGRHISLEVSSKLAVQGGVPIGFQGIARDVTERKAAREELEQSSALLRIAGQAAHLGGWKLELPERTLTWSDENCIIHDVLPGYVPTLDEGIASYYPEHRTQVLDCVNRCAENGTPYDFELPIVTAKGRHIWIRSIGEAVRDTDGKIVRLQGAIQDITDRKKAEEALRQKDSLIRIAGEVTRTGGWAIEVLTQQLFWSDEVFDILEFPRGEIPELEVALELYPQPGRDTVVAGLEACSKDGIPLDIEVEIDTASGRRIWVRICAEADRKADGTITRVQGAFQDISDRKQTEEQLRQSQKLESVGRLTGGIAHDFNNMLTAINGYSDLALRKLGSDDPVRRNIEEIKKAGMRSAALTNQLLAFSRNQILHPELVGINDVIVETSNMLERLIGEDIELVTVLKTNVGKIKADLGQLNQIVLNLAVNARDAMPTGGKLTIETSNIFVDLVYAHQHVGLLPGAYVVLSISDTGTGITPEIRKHIFEPFFTTKEVGKGTGLGLATVHGIVKQSGGDIFVYSEIDHGTTFKIYLPRVVDGDASRAVNADTTPKLAVGGERILLVEDEDLVRSLSKEILESCGYTVIEARDGIEALEIMEKAEIAIDLLLTDVVMPRMGGRELAEKLNTKMPDLPILFASGYTDDAIVRHGVLETNVNFIQKPYSLDDLARKIRDLLDAKK